MGYPVHLSSTHLTHAAQSSSPSPVPSLSPVWPVLTALVLAGLSVVGAKLVSAGVAPQPPQRASLWALHEVAPQPQPGLELQELALQQAQMSRPLLLLPMIGTLDNCLFSEMVQRPHHSPACGDDGGTPAAGIENTLQALGPAVSADGRYQVGYTLNVPLLRFFVAQPDGGWAIDRDAARRVAQTIRDVKRPMVLYFFSTHFSADTPMEKALAADSRNFAVTPDGPLKNDKHYHVDVFPWSVATTDNEVARRRKEAMEAVLKEVCALDEEAQSHVQGVTVLGEVHQLFPGFEAGMGFDRPYRVSDYSDASKAQFTDYLREHFQTIEALNAALGSDYTDWAQVQPPSLDIRHDRLTRFQDHIDAYAHGVLPVSGWAQVQQEGKPVPTWVRVFVNGKQVVRVPTTMGRQDVFTAKPELQTANVGWRYDLDFSQWKPGFYRITTALDRGTDVLERMTSKMVAVGDRAQSAPATLEQQPLPLMMPLRAGSQFWVDTPTDQTTVYYNPLVPVWHAFRAQQVARYLKFHAQTVQQSCLGQRGVYTHQIIPFTNPGWDSTRFAVEDTLRPDTGMSLGISLYGDPAYSHRVVDWLRTTQRAPMVDGKLGAMRPYGITEFHPLKAMDAPHLGAALRMHQASGARFVSFFLEPRTATTSLTGKDAFLFSFDPDKTALGSDALYRSVQQLLSPVTPAHSEVALVVTPAQPGP